MWTIRQEQVDTLRQSSLRKFEDEMVNHLQKFSPPHWKLMSEAHGRRVIRWGMEQAKKYGFTNRGPVRFYLELMFLFGSYFDSDPQYPWASFALQHPEPLDQMHRAERAYAGMSEYLTQVAGERSEHISEALRRVSQARMQDFVTPGKTLEENIAEGLRSIYPQKCAYVGAAGMKALVRYGLELAQRCEFSTHRGRVLIVGLAFAFGHGFLKDPLFPWIAAVFNNPELKDGGAREQQLLAESTTYMRHVGSYLEAA